VRRWRRERVGIITIVLLLFIPTSGFRDADGEGPL